MALSALLLLLPLLLNVQNIPDESVQSDVKAVDSAISSLEQWKDPRNSLASLDSQLTEPQRALAKMFWELETIEKEKPKAPPQFDLGLFLEALEAMVEMNEEAKEVKLRKDKLTEWAGGEKANEGKTKEEETVPEVRVNENVKVEVTNGAGGDGKMEVKRGKDENGNEQVVVTFVKRDGTEGKTEEEQKKEEKDNLRKGREEVKMEQDNVEGAPKTDSANSAKSPIPMPTILSSPAAPAEEEEKANDAFTEANVRKKVKKDEEMFIIMTDDNGRTGNANERQMEFVRMPKKVGRDFGSELFGLPQPSNGGQSPMEMFFNLFGRKKRETVQEGRKKRSIENLANLGKPGSEFVTKMAEQAKNDDKQDEKAEIKQYLEKGVATAEGNKKAEKLAYVWYSELLYWTNKWIEALENRVMGVKPELAQQFVFSKTGMAAYKELKEEVDKCEAKLAKLKEWIGDYFK
uniref:Esophageal gland-localized secretory protein 3 n=1 Tax=Heterodera glycines TaxID=51029 RepID=A0A0E3GIM0_HETGL|nr:esophageal gland-localized secretory protein 3 [Heterodera glycines]